jgi:hypothetical protein
VATFGRLQPPAGRFEQVNQIPDFHHSHDNAARCSGVLNRTGVVVSFVVIVWLCRPVEAGSGLFEAGDAEQGELDFIG